MEWCERTYCHQQPYNVHSYSGKQFFLIHVECWQSLLSLFSCRKRQHNGFKMVALSKLKQNCGKRSFLAEAGNHTTYFDQFPLNVEWYESLWRWYTPYQAERYRFLEKYTNKWSEVRWTYRCVDTIGWRDILNVSLVIQWVCYRVIGDATHLGEEIDR